MSDTLASYSETHPTIAMIISLLVLCISVFLIHVIVRAVVRRLCLIFFSRMPDFLTAMLRDFRLINRVALYVPLAFFYQGLVFIPNLSPDVMELCHRFLETASIILGLGVITLTFSITNEIYNRYAIAASRPIKGYLQVITIILYIFGFILAIAIIFDKSPLVFLSGLGAMTAIIMLVFKDTILSLVAGVQLTVNNLIRVGDWIEMPQFNADGFVIDIALHVVRVQNWDKTITVIPAHKFLENSFKNWRGMQESGGRRIKRSFYIDMNTIKFLEADDIAHFRKFALLTEYIEQKSHELHEYNKQYDSSVTVNVRRLTNIGTFRAYVINYLKQHPMIRKDMTFLVRQLQPTPEGLPIEVYVFTDSVVWTIYEGVQADVFDHVLAIAREFDLAIFQKPSGRDLRVATGEPVLALGGADD